MHTGAVRTDHFICDCKDCSNNETIVGNPDSSTVYLDAHKELFRKGWRCITAKDIHFCPECVNEAMKHVQNTDQYDHENFPRLAYLLEERCETES